MSESGTQLDDRRDEGGPVPPSFSPPGQGSSTTTAMSPGSARTVWDLWRTVPLSVWRGNTVEALSFAEEAIRRRGIAVALMAFGVVGILAGLASFFAVLHAPGNNVGAAFVVLLTLIVLVVAVYFLRCLTLWGALKVRRGDVPFASAVGIVLVPACLHVFALAVAATLSLLPGSAGRVLQTVIAMPITVLVVLVTEPLVYIGAARKAGSGRSILMPNTWLFLVFCTAVAILVPITAVIGVATLVDQLTNSLSGFGGAW